MSGSRFSIILLLICILSLQADEVTSRPIGPGVIHYHELRTAGPWRIHVVEIDLSNPHMVLETVKAQDLLAGYERTSSMAQRSDGEAHRVVAAMNGDFYNSGGIPVNAQVRNGSLLKRPYSRTVFGVGPQLQPFMEIVQFQGSVATQEGASHNIQGINETRQNNWLVLFNRYQGSRTGSNQWGTELKCEWVDPPLVNETRRLVVLDKDSVMTAGSGNNVIPSNGVVLSGHGTAHEFLDSAIFVGDTLSLNLDLTPVETAIWQLIGGTPRLIRDGVISVEWEAEGVGSAFAYDRHPRTAVGISSDSSKVYFFTVDGRQPGYSVGMSLPELADLMLDYNVYQGVNLDGGGSTTMVVRGNVVSSPSDAGGERSVANALLAISTAPTGDLDILRIEPRDFHVLADGSVQLDVLGFDSTYNPLPVPTESITWSCDPEIGSITTAGLFTAAADSGTGYVWVNLADIVDSTQVTVTRLTELVLSPDPVVLETGQTQTMAVSGFDGLGNPVALLATDLEWWYDTDLLTMEQPGHFTAQIPGTGILGARSGNVADSVEVNVGMAVSNVIDDFSSVDNWELSGLRVDLAACDLAVDASIFQSAPSSGRLEYSLTTGGVSVLYLNGEVLLSGSPSEVSLAVYGDGSGHWLRGEFATPTGNLFLIDFTSADPGIDWDGSWQTLTVDLAEATPHWGNPNATVAFPITWTKIYLAETDEDHKDDGVIYLDDFTAHYVTAIDASQPAIIPRTLEVKGPYPNPFNATTRFEFQIGEPGKLTVTIYDLGGRELYHQESAATPGTMSMSWEAALEPAGLYLYRVSLGAQIQVGKCLLLK